MACLARSIKTNSLKRKKYVRNSDLPKERKYIEENISEGKIKNIFFLILNWSNRQQFVHIIIATLHLVMYASVYHIYFYTCISMLIYNEMNSSSVTRDRREELRYFAFVSYLYYPSSAMFLFESRLRLAVNVHWKM